MLRSALASLMLLGALRSVAAGQPTYPGVNIETLAGAKVLLCKGFAEDTVDFYMAHKMRKEYETYAKATEFEREQTASLRELALQRMHQEAVGRFDPATVYEVPDRGALLSEFKRAPGGFNVELPGSTQFDPGYFSVNGRKELINVPELYGLKNVLDYSGVVASTEHFLVGHTAIGLDGDGDPIPERKYEVHSRLETHRSGLPYLQLAYGLMPDDRTALQVTDGHFIFLPVEEARARQIVELYRGKSERRAVADLFVRITKCVQQQQTGPGTLIARLVGFKLYAAQLEQGFFETTPNWKRKQLITDWRSVTWGDDAH
jgi:hypothetical protein